MDKTTARQLGIADFEAYRDQQPITQETQAEFLVRMYRLAFAHPAAEECTYWDLCDSYTWNRVEGGLIDENLEPKPAYFALQKLIHETWHTAALLESDAGGRCVFSGFDGDYEISVGEEKRRIHFSKEDARQKLCL